MNSPFRHILFWGTALVFGGVLLFPYIATADITLPSDLGVNTIAEKAELNKETDLPTITGKVLGAALSLIGLTFFILTIYAGVIWMTAHGNEESVTKAKNTLIAASIGLFIVLGSYAITKFAFEALDQGASAGGSPQSTNNNRCAAIGPGFTCKNIAACGGIDNPDDINAARNQCQNLDSCQLNLCPGGNDVVCCQ